VTDEVRPLRSSSVVEAFKYEFDDEYEHDFPNAA